MSGEQPRDDTNDDNNSRQIITTHFDFRQVNQTQIKILQGPHKTVNSEILKPWHSVRMGSDQKIMTMLFYKRVIVRGWHVHCVMIFVIVETKFLKQIPNTEIDISCIVLDRYQVNYTGQRWQKVNNKPVHHSQSYSKNVRPLTNIFKQECIRVGCIPPALYCTQGFPWQRPPGQRPKGRDLPGQRLPWT